MAIADRVMLLDLSIGKTGFLGYLKALGGSNIIKVIPSNGSASDVRANGNKSLKVICGANTSYLTDNDWIGEKTPLTFCDVRVSPHNSVKPNLGATELAEALAKVIPFTAKEDDRPVLQCVNFVAKDGKLTLVSADGFRLAMISLDCEVDDSQALIHRDELKGLVNALKRARRARISFEPDGETLDGISLVIDTELIRYKWHSVDGKYPDYEKLIPTDFNTVAHLDTIEALKAVNSLKALAFDNDVPIDLTIGNGKVVMASPDDKGQAEVLADTDGDGYVRVNGQYLAEVLRACGDMVNLKLINSSSPMLFSHNGYQVVVMPMLTDKAKTEQKAEVKAEQRADVIRVPIAPRVAYLWGVKVKVKTGKPTIVEPVAEKPTVVEPVAEKHKRKRTRARELVAVA